MNNDEQNRTIDEGYSSHIFILNKSILNNKGLYEFTLVATDQESKTPKKIKIEVYNWKYRKLIPTIDTTWILLFSLASGILSFGVGFTIAKARYKKSYLVFNRSKYRKR